VDFRNISDSHHQCSGACDRNRPGDLDNRRESQRRFREYYSYGCGPDRSNFVNFTIIVDEQQRTIHCPYRSRESGQHRGHSNTCERNLGLGRCPDAASCTQECCSKLIGYTLRDVSCDGRRRWNGIGLALRRLLHCIVAGRRSNKR
jgi:hypothetical protein